MRGTRIIVAPCAIAMNGTRISTNVQLTFVTHQQSINLQKHVEFSPQL